MADEKKPTGEEKNVDSSKAEGAAKKGRAKKTAGSKAASAKKAETTAKAPAKTVQRVKQAARQAEALRFPYFRPPEPGLLFSDIP